MRSTPVIVLIAALMSGCATGYGALAGGGAVATVAFVGAVASGEVNVASATGGGFAIGALAGAIGGAVAGAIVRGKELRTTDELRAQLQRQRYADEQTVEERLQRLEAARFSSSNSAASDDRQSDAKQLRRERSPRRRDNGDSPQASDELSPHVREFSADP